MHIRTVRITSTETVSGFIVINEADFDPSKHQIWNSEVTVATPEPDSSRPLDQMTLAELRDHAKAHGIAIPATLTAKADVLAHVLASGNASAADGTVQPQA
ncbi:Rho termination factor N-terminal domain-containing protein [Bilophila wadsworthia]|uniref:Rho termination factor N-terminal domain-containing protein n=1 Tax=Bilophila wadsworthia TaxID=35833 RepID=UPI0026765DD7|nr:Rho termination factor N-terminal domain-containing protein [Bilophila wadsworthia]